jgi:hypothetical protein
MQSLIFFCAGLNVGHWCAYVLFFSFVFPSRSKVIDRLGESAPADETMTMALTVPSGAIEAGGSIRVAMVDGSEYNVKVLGCEIYIEADYVKGQTNLSFRLGARFALRARGSLARSNGLSLCLRFFLEQLVRLLTRFCIFVHMLLGGGGWWSDPSRRGARAEIPRGLSRGADARRGRRAVRPRRWSAGAL